VAERLKATHLGALYGQPYRRFESFPSPPRPEQAQGALPISPSLISRLSHRIPVSFQLTNRESYGHVATLDEAKVAFKAKYAAWRATQ
jgi:hypothetical protein